MCRRMSLGFIIEFHRRWLANFKCWFVYRLMKYMPPFMVLTGTNSWINYASVHDYSPRFALGRYSSCRSRKQVKGQAGQLVHFCSSLIASHCRSRRIMWAKIKCKLGHGNDPYGWTATRLLKNNGNLDMS